MNHEICTPMPSIHLDPPDVIKEAKWILNNIAPGMYIKTTDGHVRRVQYVAHDGKAVKCENMTGFVFYKDIVKSTRNLPIVVRKGEPVMSPRMQKQMKKQAQV